MRYACLACDFDGTIARDGIVSASTVDALRRLRSSGRKVILATGREIDDLRAVFPELGMFDRIVAENGGVLFRPGSGDRIRLGEPPSPAFIEELHRRGVQPLSVGNCVVATWHPHEKTVLEVVRDMNLELHIIFNKGAVMVLPSGVNKGTGLEAALQELGLSAHNVVGVGDAENDHGFLTICECSVAVGNALPSIKERADWVTAGTHGSGVEELIADLLKNDLEELSPRLKRHEVALGNLEGGEQFALPVYGAGAGILVAGPSGQGKSTTVSAIVERLVEKKCQVCLFDPEGDYDEFKPLVALGGPNQVPTSKEVLDVLANPVQSVSVNLLGVPLADRPAAFKELLVPVQGLRGQKARPHWVVVDEAHHLLPRDSRESAAPSELYNFLLVTVNPDSVSPHFLRSCGGIIAVGQDPQTVIDQFNNSVGREFQFEAKTALRAQPGKIMVWLSGNPSTPCYVKVKLADSELRRHKRKYAAGELGEDKSFYFRGAEGKLNLRAQNLNLFAQLAEGVDSETWAFHLSRRDYSKWLNEMVKDEELARVVAEIETQKDLSPLASREKIIEAIRQHYTSAA